MFRIKQVHCAEYPVVKQGIGQVTLGDTDKGVKTQAGPVGLAPLCPRAQPSAAGVLEFAAGAAFCQCLRSAGATGPFRHQLLFGLRNSTFQNVPHECFPSCLSCYD